MGKFGYKYFQTNYQINGDVTSAPYPFDFEGEKELGRNSTGISYNQNNDKGILEFGELF